MPAKGESIVTQYSHDPRLTHPPAQPRARRAVVTNANPARWSTAAIAEMAIAVALAAAIGLVKLFVMPQGGSVSLEMIPILFIAIRRGLVPGITVGVVYGFVQLLLPGAFLVQPVQVLLDYPLAFGALGLAALVAVPVWPGRASVSEASASPFRSARTWFFASLIGAVAVGVAARFVCHFLSGIIFFASYAPAGQPVWIYSLTYNLLYLVPEAFLTIVLLVFLVAAYDEAYAARGRTVAP
jgi:thiamine transporter